jgi:hypothetical protein
MLAEQIVNDAVAANPEMRLVLDIAGRVRAAKLITPPIEIGVATDTVAIPVKSQYPVSLVLPG